MPHYLPLYLLLVTKTPRKSLIYRAFNSQNVVRLGFEPRKAEPKTAVLPLHHRTVLGRQK